MPRDAAAEAEKAAKMDAAVKRFLELKEVYPNLTVADAARDYGVNLNTMRAHVRKASGRTILTIAEEARLVGYAMGLYENDGICNRKMLLQQARAIQKEKDPCIFSGELVDRNWIKDFLKRNPDLQLRTTPDSALLPLVPLSFPRLQRLWENLAQTALKYELVDPSQFWYLSNTSFFLEFKDRKFQLGSKKSHDEDLWELQDEEEYPITALLGYSAAGQLSTPTLIFEEDDLREVCSNHTESPFLTGGTPDGLVDAKEGLNWLEAFEASSSKHIKAGQWRILIMDGSPFHQEDGEWSSEYLDFVQYAIDHNILIFRLNGDSSIHDYLSRPADIHVFDDMKKVYKDTDDDQLVDDDFDGITRDGFYNMFGSTYKTAFADPEICRNAFKDAGIFPINLGNNEKVMALKATHEAAEGGEKPPAMAIEQVKVDSPLEPEQLHELINEHLSKVDTSRKGGQSVSSHADYLLLHHARRLLDTQTARLRVLQDTVENKTLQPVAGTLEVRSPTTACSPSPTALRSSKRANAQSGTSNKRKKKKA